MTLVLINCKDCISGNHDKCSSESCLCADDNHGIKEDSLLDGVLVRSYMDAPKDEPMNYERARKDSDRLKNFQDDGLGNNSPEFVLIEMTKLLIITKHIISKFEIIKELTEWCKSNRVDVRIIDDSIEIVFSDIDYFGYIKSIAHQLGMKNEKVQFDKSQLIEAGEWIRGSKAIKRIELTGDMLFFNGKYYERNAEALIRRIARDIIHGKPKTNDITEIVHYIEDKSNIITWKDIEHSIHIKCLNNGLYDIKTGVFVTKFNPDYIILGQIPHNYNESSTYNEIDKVVDSLIENKEDKQSFYDFISTCLHPYTGVDFQFGFVGIAGTGKSQLGELVKLVLGQDNYKGNKIHDIAKDQTTQIDAAFSMLNFDDDLNDQSIKQIDVIKKWVTQSTFTARSIYKQPTTFRPMSRLMFSANDLYEIPNHDDAEAVYDRTYLVRIDKKYRHGTEEIKNIMSKVATDTQLDGFITFLLKNATWMAENEKYHYPIPVSKVESIWNTYGNRIAEFKKKWVIVDTRHRLDSADPFNKWTEYCNLHHYKTKTRKEFKEIFDELVGNIPTKTRKIVEGTAESVEVYAYTGIRLKTDEEITFEEQNKLSGKPDEKALKALLISYMIMFSKIKKNKIKIKSTELLELGDNS